MVMQAVKKKAVKTKNAGNLRVAIVMSLFNEPVCRGLLDGARACLEENGIDPARVPVFEVPGAFEIPLLAQSVLKVKKYAGVVALGCIIRGETPHFEYVSGGSMLGCQLAALNTGKPVAFGILTTDTEEQAKRRSSPDAFNKGREAVHALLTSIETLKTVRG